MKLEVVKSVIRSIIQLLGVLIIINIQIPFIEPLNKALVYLLGEFDNIVATIQALIGFAITLAGFFYDKSRFEERNIGKIISEKAKSKGIKVSEYLK